MTLPDDENRNHFEEWGQSRLQQGPACVCVEVVVDPNISQLLYSSLFQLKGKWCDSIFVRLGHVMGQHYNTNDLIRFLVERYPD